MFLLLQARESLAYHYSVALHLHENISQCVQSVLILEQACTFTNKKESFDSEYVI